MGDYLNIFIDDDYPFFIDKYLYTITMKRIKEVTQFCGCDYTKIYNPRFLYMRFHHSLVVAHMTWHFTHSIPETIAALSHDVGTPCFAHVIDYVLGDFVNQESSERSIESVALNDKEFLEYLKMDGFRIEDISNLSKYPIVENKSPKLCVDRLDGVLHTAYIWLKTHEIDFIREVYAGVTVLKDEEGTPELGFKNVDVAVKFMELVDVYFNELQGPRDKYVMRYISEIIKKAIAEGVLTLDDLYIKKESEIVRILESNYHSWSKFNNTDVFLPLEGRSIDFYTNFETKKRTVKPLVMTKKGIIRM